MRFLPAAVVLGAVVLATGCGGAGKEVVRLDTIKKAAFTTQAVGTSRVSIKGSVTFNHDHAQRYSFKGHGVVDWQTESAKLTTSYRFPDTVQEFIKKQF